MLILQEIDYKDIIKQVHLSLSLGEKIGITGKSGSGKTTLLKIIAGLLEKTRGNIFYHQKPQKSYKKTEWHRKIQMVLQHPILFEETIEKEIKSPLSYKIYHSYSPPYNLRQVLDTFLIDFEINKETKNLSGGEKQRIALARTLFLSPDIYLLDEPTSALDSNTALQCFQNLFTLEKEKGFIIISHSESILSLLNKVYLMENKTIKKL